MKSLDVALLTESRYERPVAPDWYVQNILDDDALIVNELRRHGLRVERIDWARADVDWRTIDTAVFRTTWDYFHRGDEFRSWLQRVERECRLLNARELIWWNFDKRYLLDLESRGVNIPPTVVAPQGGTLPLAHWLAHWECNEVVVKPTVSGAARHTHRVGLHNLVEVQRQVVELLRAEAMMVQPFQQSVVNDGELSLMVIGGAYTHAVRKIAKPGDFRVQDDFGGTVHPHTASTAEIDFALRAVESCAPRPIYARVDMIRDNSGQLAISELELIEPELFLRYEPAAALRLADAIRAQL